MILERATKRGHGVPPVAGGNLFKLGFIPTTYVHLKLLKDRIIAILN